MSDNSIFLFRLHCFYALLPIFARFPFAAIGRLLGTFFPLRTFQMTWCRPEILLSFKFRAVTLNVFRSIYFLRKVGRMPTIQNGDGVSHSVSTESGNRRSAGDKVTLRFAKLTENAFAPTRGSAQAAGFDLCRFAA